MGADRYTVPAASWVSSIFVWRPPQFAFRPAEQRTLILALRGQSDEEIVRRCRISRSTLKKRWDLILSRVESIEPGFFARRPTPGRRGPEKRSSLLIYLKAHPEELRPYSK